MPNSGILLIDKPSDMTSHDLVNITRKVFNTKKVGHNGTLDPDATGVMVLCIGQATRLNEYLVADNKVYQATLTFGNETDTQDISGKIIATCDLPELTESEFKNILKGYIGVQEQTPPMYSAIKKNGKPLYQYAREGKKIDEIPKRKIEIFDIQCLSYDGNVATFIVHCSKGTYIRTLCQDIARDCGSCGCMSKLRRIQVGNFSLEQCVNVDDLRASDDPYALLMPMSEALDFPQVHIMQEDLKMDLQNGKRIPLSRCQVDDFDSNWYQAVMDEELLAVGRIENDDFVPKKVFQG